jgi:hypothetical protein
VPKTGLVASPGLATINTYRRFTYPGWATASPGSNGLAN